MTRYENGRIPKELLIHMGGEHWATAATKARIEALIADIWTNEHVRVWVTSGANVYRDLANQTATKEHFTALGRPWQAADPGASSHGGTFKGKDALAADFSGYDRLGITKWFAYLRKHGFEAGYYDGKNGRPYEPWHAIDWDPYSAPSVTGIISKPARPEEEGVDMIGIYNKDDKNEKTRRALVGEFSFQPISAWYSESQWPMFGVKNVTQSEWDATKALVNLRRASAGMKAV